MNKFEVVLLLNPELAVKKLNDEINSFKSILEARSAKVINEADRELNWDLNFSISDVIEFAFNSGLNINTTSNLFIKLHGLIL